MDYLGIGNFKRVLAQNYEIYCSLQEQSSNVVITRKEFAALTLAQLYNQPEVRLERISQSSEFYGAIEAEREISSSSENEDETLNKNANVVFATSCVAYQPFSEFESGNMIKNLSIQNFTEHSTGEPKILFSFQPVVVQSEIADKCKKIDKIANDGSGIEKNWSGVSPLGCKGEFSEDTKLQRKRKQTARNNLLFKNNYRFETIEDTDEAGTSLTRIVPIKETTVSTVVKMTELPLGETPTVVIEMPHSLKNALLDSSRSLVLDLSELSFSKNSVQEVKCNGGAAVMQNAVTSSNRNIGSTLHQILPITKEKEKNDLDEPNWKRSIKFANESSTTLKESSGRRNFEEAMEPDSTEWVDSPNTSPWVSNSNALPRLAQHRSAIWEKTNPFLLQSKQASTSFGDADALDLSLGSNVKITDPTEFIPDTVVSDENDSNKIINSSEIATSFEESTEFQNSDIVSENMCEDEDILELDFDNDEDLKNMLSSTIGTNSSEIEECLEDFNTEKKSTIKKQEEIKIPLKPTLMLPTDNYYCKPVVLGSGATEKFTFPLYREPDEEQNHSATLKESRKLSNFEGHLEHKYSKPHIQGVNLPLMPDVKPSLNLIQPTNDPRFYLQNSEILNLSKTASAPHPSLYSRMSATEPRGVISLPLPSFVYQEEQHQENFGDPNQQYQNFMGCTTKQRLQLRFPKGPFSSILRKIIDSKSTENPELDEDSSNMEISSNVDYQQEDGLDSSIFMDQPSSSQLENLDDFEMLTCDANSVVSQFDNNGIL